MDDPAGVGVGDGLRNLLEDAQEVPPPVARLRAVREHGGEGAALDELHREVGTVVRLQSEAVHRHDARVLELPADLRLLDEAGQDVLVVGVLATQDLQRDVTAQVPVAGLQDDADPAPRDLAEDLVAGIAGRLGGVRRHHPEHRRRVVRYVAEQDARPRAGGALDNVEDALVGRRRIALPEDRPDSRLDGLVADRIALFVLRHLRLLDHGFAQRNCFAPEFPFSPGFSYLISASSRAHSRPTSPGGAPG